MLLPNVNALVLALLMVCFVRPSVFIRFTTDLVIQRDSVRFHTQRAGPPRWFAGVCWLADLLWMPVMLWHVGPPSIAPMVLTGFGAEHPAALLLGLMGASAYLFVGLPRLERRLGRGSRAVGAPTSNDDGVTP